VAGVLVAVLVHQRTSPSDLTQMTGSFNALLGGHLRAVYPSGTGMTSPPGFLLLAAPAVALLGGDSSARVPQVVLALLSAGLLALAADRLVRRMRPGRRGPARLGVTVAVLLGAPTIGAVYGPYHPEDLVATAFVLLALADTGCGHDRRAGLALGVALLTRQWALLAFAPVLLASGPGWRRVGVTAGAACLVVLAPFAVASPGGLLRALEAPSVVVSKYSLWSYIGLPGSFRYAAARLAPIACCVPTGLVLRHRWRRTPPQPSQVAAATAIVVGYRGLLDPAAEPYYLLPFFLLLVVLALCERDRRQGVWCLVVVLALEVLLLLEPYTSYGAAETTVTLAVTLAVAEMGGFLCGWRIVGNSSPLSGRRRPPITIAVVGVPDGRRSPVPT
jgi:hypothetical protein